jgi:glycerol kinase
MAAPTAADCILVIDQGTTSTRAIVFDQRAEAIGVGQFEITLHFPHSGWVEQDPEEIWASVEKAVTKALAESGVSTNRIAALGITNQRETTIVWEKATGKAAAPAIVWQDRRTADTCRSLSAHRESVRAKTGLELDPYFSSTKIGWILDNAPGTRAKAEAGELLFGTVDSYLIWRLTAGARHVTDVTNASRTMLMDLATGVWDDSLCDIFSIPKAMLPEILPSVARFGETRGLGWLPDGLPILGAAGDQQASCVGQACVKAGQTKCTYGTGAFLVSHTGDTIVRSTNGLLTTRAATLTDGRAQFALEGSVFVAGAAVQWFRDGLKAVGAAPEINPLALKSETSEVLFVPALTGLGAPYWNPEARGTIFGLTRATGLADLARATLEGVAYQVADLIEAIAADTGTPLAGMSADGGMSDSDLFLQLQADILGFELHRSLQREATALGAAVLAGLGAGLWKSVDEAFATHTAAQNRFAPSQDAAWRKSAMDRWHKAIAAVNGFYG